MPIGQNDLDNASFRFTSQVTLSCIKLIVKTSQKCRRHGSVVKSPYCPFRVQFSAPTSGDSQPWTLALMGAYRHIHIITHKD